jgi:hypothetical protein
METSSYKRAAIIAIAIAICGAIGLLVITRQYVYDQISLDDSRRQSKPVLGGPTLTAEARAEAVMKPKMSRQELFATLQYDPERMWETGPRATIVVVHRAIALFTGIAIVLALTHAASAVLLAELTRRSQVALSLSLTESAIVRTGRHSVAVHASITDCDPTVRWKIDAPSWAKNIDMIGEVSAEGNYFPPEVIRRDVDVFVVATPVAHPRESKQVQIQLRAEPEYVQPPLPSTGSDEQGKTVELLIKVLDERYSWEIGKTRLNDIDGATFAQQMARDGMFEEAKQIICVGAASREYVTKNDEEMRAMNRALTLAQWVGSAVQYSKPVWALKVGRFNAESLRTPAETANERQVVIVGVLNAENGVNMLAAVRDAFRRKRESAPALGRYLDNYPAQNWVISRVGVGTDSPSPRRGKSG